MSRLLSMICSAAAMLAVSSGVFADTTTTTTTTMSTNNKKDKAPFFEQGMPLDVKNARDGKYPMGYNAPASVEVDYSWDMDINAAFTYWYASQDAMDVTHVAPVEAAPAAGATGSVVYQNFGYAPGFKVGIGFDMKQKCDNWTMNAEYTWYNKTQTGSATAPAAGFTENDLFPYTTGALAATAVANSWKLNLQVLDLEGGRPFYQGKNVTLSPAGGLRFLWIHQTQTVGMTEGADVRAAALSSSSWAVGPKAGVNGHWMIWKGLRVDTLMGSSLLYTRYTNISASQASATTAGVVTGAVTSSTSYGSLRPTMDMGLGLGYGAYMFSNKFFFDLSARYDFMQFWSQNVMRNFVSQLAGRDDAVGDLRLHGLTLNLRCDF